MPVLNRDDYTSPLVLYEIPACNSINQFNLSELRVFVYHPDDNRKLYFDAEIIEPNPLPDGFLGLANDINFSNKFKILKAWGGRLDEAGNPDPSQVNQPQTVSFLGEEFFGFAYGMAKFSWCINHNDTPLENVKVRLRVCDDKSVCDSVYLLFNLPERNQAPIFSSANYNKQVFVNYEDNRCYDDVLEEWYELDCSSAPDCSTCKDSNKELKSCCQNASIEPFQISVSDPDLDPINCSFTNQDLANSLGLEIIESTCTVSSASFKPDWNNLLTSNSYQIEIKAEDEPLNPEVEPGALEVRRTFNINLIDVNYPPFITSNEPATAYDGLSFTHTLYASDPNLTLNFKKILFTLEAGLNQVPNNMQLISNCEYPSTTCQATINWTPSDEQAKAYSSLNIKVRATDCMGSCSGNEKSYVKDLNINLIDINQEPKIYSSKAYYYLLADGSTYSYTISAIDPDIGDAISIETLNSAGLSSYLSNLSASSTNSVNLQVSISPDISLVREEPYEIIYRASDGILNKDTSIFLYILDKNKILSRPTKQARVDSLYTYKLITTKQSNLIYEIVSCGVSSCSFNANVFSFTPGSMDANKYHNFKIRVKDGSNFEEQEWSVYVKMTNTSPVLNLEEASSSSIEDSIFILGISVYDANSNDILLTSIYVNDVWQEDIETNNNTNFDFNYYLNTVSSGINIIKVVLSDGISSQEKTHTIDVKNNYPVFSSTSILSLEEKTLGFSIFNEKTNQFMINFFETFSKKLSFLNLDLSYLDRSCLTLNYEPEKIVLDNASQSNFFVYFAKYGDPDAENNVYTRYRAQNNTCSNANYKEQVFNNTTYKNIGGVKFADIEVAGVNKRYYIDSLDRTKLRVYGEINHVLVLDDLVSNLYALKDKAVLIALIPSLKKISIIDPSDNTIITDIDLSSLDPVIVDPFMCEYINEVLYVYSANGVLSLVYLNDLDFINEPAPLSYFTVNFDNLPANNSIINDEHNMILYNDYDSLLYILSPNAKAFSIMDLSSSYKINSLTWNETSNYSYFMFSKNPRALFLVDKENAEIVEIK